MGRVVKSLGRVVPAPVLSASEEAARLRAEAAAVLARATAEAAELRARAERAGHEAGFAAGREEGLAQVTALIAGAQAQARRIADEARGSAVVLGRRIAEKVIGRAVTVEPELMAQMAASALAASRARGGTIVVRVHPDDLAAVEAHRPRLAAALPAADLRLVTDPAVSPHGCIVDTPAGRLDARLETQLDALERALLGGVG